MPAPALLDCDKIRVLREGRGLTQAEAAKLADMKTRQEWNDIEGGRRKNITLELLSRIAAALGVNAKELLK